MWYYQYPHPLPRHYSSRCTSNITTTQQNQNWEPWSYLIYKFLLILVSMFYLDIISPPCTIMGGSLTLVDILRNFPYFGRYSSELPLLWLIFFGTVPYFGWYSSEFLSSIVDLFGYRICTIYSVGSFLRSPYVPLATIFFSLGYRDPWHWFIFSSFHPCSPSSTLVFAPLSVWQISFGFREIFHPLKCGGVLVVYVG